VGRRSSLGGLRRCSIRASPWPRSIEHNLPAQPRDLGAHVVVHRRYSLASGQRRHDPLAPDRTLPGQTHGRRCLARDATAAAAAAATTTATISTAAAAAATGAAATERHRRRRLLLLLLLLLLL
jgi:hypothetical protein